MSDFNVITENRVNNEKNGMLHASPLDRSEECRIAGSLADCPCEGRSLGSEDMSVGHRRESSQYCLNEKSAVRCSSIFVGSNAVNVAFQLPWLQAEFHTDR